ncbi:hypothetical protein AVEN_45370-1, partial [Araneus ventricosus]
MNLATLGLSSKSHYTSRIKNNFTVNDQSIPFSCRHPPPSIYSGVPEIQSQPVKTSPPTDSEKKAEEIQICTTKYISRRLRPVR